MANIENKRGKTDLNEMIDPELLKNKVIFQSNVLDVLDAVTI